MKKHILVLVLSCLVILTLLLAACGGQETTTTSTTTSTTTTSPSNTTTTTTTTSTTTTHTTTQTTTTTTTTTQTVAENPFHGSVSGNWSGNTLAGESIRGTFSVTIDEEGDVTGTFSGDYIGTITGHVDESGTLNAIGKSTIGGESIQFIWEGTATLSGTTISVQGNWSGPLASGTFIGSGQTA